ncbi:MAG: amidophosphoribosyltransferase [Candidatus Competibacteraceae bacterium]|nr:amidophosphoribosyltransferase [Candidatus Competibacteraceae bacterium]MBK7983542.1 amidophosphoribosyltransferase [Candidatus Competibacteraceae bacterium]MBK8897918.1 amidophosphoribosyltransferase [Candidatus Competibacteraceae bacterium]MBK8961721.1 amidophosphoribosyltransferase [Candidatus Competibacteraceae bacterium]MBK9950940.1 amidophosphoribosyltransferase [Candidatus Competibacteraceae bacterium]
MCGIIGIAGRSPVNQSLFDGLTVLQHRGQDAAGIVTCDEGRLFLRKDNGLIRDVVRTRHMLNLHGNIGIGHVRYPTAGSSDSAEAQPFYVNSPFGITLAHNGNLTNSAQLKDELFRSDLRHINTNSDSEILLNVFAHELQQRSKLSVDAEDIFAAVAAVHRRVRGAYAAVALIVGFGLVAFRDPYGIRPLVFGRRETEHGMEYMVASESVALDVLDFRRVRDVAPGEAVLFDLDGQIHTRQCAEQPVNSPCIFEFVYLARPDSIIDQVSVHKARLRMGEYLAEKILRIWPEQDIDVVIPIPDTSRTAALQMASILGLKYREGFIKNRYIARTFIMPGQKIRKKSVRQKLNPIDLEFRGKNVLLVDDSIVRGTTSEQIIQMAREAGARRVYFASAAPPVRYPNVYGIDMPAAHELIAHDRSEEEVARAIGADYLIFQDMADLEEAVRRGNSRLQRFDASCFTGEYVTGDIDRHYLERLARSRCDTAKTRQGCADSAIIDLHNNN